MNSKKGLVINDERREVFLDGSRLHLPPKTYLLLITLLTERRAWSREELLVKVWGHDANTVDGIDTRTIDQHVTRLRRILSANSAKSLRRGGHVMRANQEFIETVSSFGYRAASGI